MKITFIPIAIGSVLFSNERKKLKEIVKRQKKTIERPPIRRTLSYLVNVVAALVGQCVRESRKDTPRKIDTQSLK